MNLCQGWQQVLQYAGWAEERKMSETLECRWTWMTLESTNSGMKKEAENEFCRGWRQVLQYAGVGRGKKNVGDTGMPPDVDNVRLDN
jgi:hypothetical protein